MAAIQSRSSTSTPASPLDARQREQPGGGRRVQAVAGDDVRFRVRRQARRPVVVDEKRRDAVRPNRFRAHAQVADDQRRRAAVVRAGQRFRPTTRCRPCPWPRLPPAAPPGAARASGWRRSSARPHRCGRARGRCRLVPALLRRTRANFRRLAATKSGGRSATAASAVWATDSAVRAGMCNDIRFDGAGAMPRFRAKSRLRAERIAFGRARIVDCHSAFCLRRNPPRRAGRPARRGGVHRPRQRRCPPASRSLRGRLPPPACARPCANPDDFPGGWERSFVVARRRRRRRNPRRPRLPVRSRPHARLALGSVGDDPEDLDRRSRPPCSTV